MCSLFICNTGAGEDGGLLESLCIRLHIQYFLKNWLKMRFCIIGLINFMVILVIFCLVCTQIHVIIHPTIKKYTAKYNIIIIHKKINLNDHFTVPGPGEADDGGSWVSG